MPKNAKEGQDPLDFFITKFVAENQNNQRVALWRHQEVLEKSNKIKNTSKTNPSELSSNDRSFKTMVTKIDTLWKHQGLLASEV